MEALVSLYSRCLSTADASAWDRLVDALDGPLRRRARRALLRAGQACDREHIDDLVQETYCRLLERGGRGFRGRLAGELHAYVGRIADNLVVDRVRSETAQKRLPETRRLPGDGTELAQVPDRESSPEDRLLARERRRLFLRLCRDLLGTRESHRDLDLLRWSVIEGWTSREISSALDGSLLPSSVDSRLHRLRGHLAGRGLQIPDKRRLPLEC